MKKYPSHPFGLMFHHFYDEDQHPYIQGALSSDDFRKILDGSLDLNILDAKAWLSGYENGSLRKNDVVLTFDDALRSQYDIALPIMREYDIKAFWFVYSGVFEQEMELFEMFRFFRNIGYETVEDYYAHFFASMKDTWTDVNWEEKFASSEAINHLSEFTIYTPTDKKFRFARDVLLSPQEFEDLNLNMMRHRDFDVEAWKERIWLTDASLKDLVSQEQELGLHSYSHPVNFRRLGIEEQVRQYSKNSSHLTSILGYTPQVMSHPSNSYDDNTLQILRGLGVKYGFRANLENEKPSKLELPRVDINEFINFHVNSKEISA